MAFTICELTGFSAQMLTSLSSSAEKMSDESSSLFQRMAALRCASSWPANSMPQVVQYGPVLCTVQVNHIIGNLSGCQNSQTMSKVSSMHLAQLELTQRLRKQYSSGHCLLNAQFCSSTTACDKGLGAVMTSCERFQRLEIQH